MSLKFFAISFFFCFTCLLNFSSKVHACEVSYSKSIASLEWNIKKKKQQKAKIIVSFDGKPPTCAESLVFFTHQGEYLQFDNGSNLVNATITDRNLNRYPVQMVDGRMAYVVPLTRKRNQRFWLTIVSTTAPYAGQYLAQLESAVQADTYDLVFETISSATLSVPNLLEISAATESNPRLSGVKDGYHLDLGVIQSGFTTFWDMDITTNTNFDMTISTEYGGLRHDSGQHAIPYSISLSGNWTSAQNSLTNTYSASHQLETFTIPLGIQVGSTDFSHAGDYVDWMIVTVSAK